MVKDYFVTAAGLKKMEEELNSLKNKMMEVAGEIKEARSFGDLSENSEYDAAKNKQAQIQEEIYKLENMIKHAVIIEEDTLSEGMVTIGAKVKVHDNEFDEDIEYTIVGSNEANASEGKISNVSPIGKSLLGKSAGDVVEVETPMGVNTLTILDVIK